MISLSDTGVFIVVYSVMTRVLVSAGAIDTLQERVAFIPPAGSSPLGPQNTDGIPAIALANKVNDVSNVWVEVHRHNGSYYWNAGDLGVAINQQVINSWTVTGTHFDAGDSNPSVAGNDSGVVVSVHSTGNKLYYNIGTVDTNHNTVHIGGGKYYGVGTLPQIALSNKGQVVEIYLGKEPGRGLPRHAPTRDACSDQ